MTKQNQIILTGKYVQLEQLNETHRSCLKEISRDERISIFSPALKLKFDVWFDKALKPYEKSRQLSFVVRDLSNHQLVGSTRYYEICPEHKRLAIGYTWYVPTVWGSFINPESKLLLLQYAFDVLKINRIEFFIDARNAQSRAAVKKLGAKEEGLLRQHIVLDDGYIRDTAVYSILHSEWLEVLHRLEGRLQILTNP